MIVAMSIPSQRMDASSQGRLGLIETVDSHKLQIFYIVASCGSIGDAARRMHLTRSALSHALKSLELDLGCELFLRADRKLTLTSCGQQLLPMAASILSQMADLRSRLTAVSC